eukprot:CAMPEP_0202863296 /NCGR_PEP_ID=MMETSP1391-20130828/3982_1 /ASSEMBLY_ACC=CAM_ASM_000867 /TAXON_ID=1034604 /ORGANISM="Chlamydomonas leiostraca, Strain SAG 11-49" /LENGTH=511 /DNA_ID=CAMNT_0049542913 /DNA_START=185 /DNA_END=1716 /DNA_ORIENTATION=+
MVLLGLLLPTQMMVSVLAQASIYKELNEQHKALMDLVLSGQAPQGSTYNNKADPLMSQHQDGDCAEDTKVPAPYCMTECSSQTTTCPNDGSTGAVSCCYYSLGDQTWRKADNLLESDSAWEFYSGQGLAGAVAQPRAPLCLHTTRQVVQIDCNNIPVPRFYTSWTSQASWQAAGYPMDTFTENKDSVRKITLSMPATQASVASVVPTQHLDKPWQFTMVDSLLCLPLEELYSEGMVWKASFFVMTDVPNMQYIDGCPNGVDALNGASCPLLHNLIITEPQLFTSSFNQNIANRAKFRDVCRFYPAMERNAAAWDTLNDFAGRKFLTDTLRVLSITRPYDSAYTKPFTSQPAVSGPLPENWNLFQNLETINLRDYTGQGGLTGGIPKAWFWGPNRMTKLQTIDVRGHPNFCRDWYHAVVWNENFQMLYDNYLYDSWDYYYYNDRFDDPWEDFKWEFFPPAPSNPAYWGANIPIDDLQVITILADGKCCFQTDTLTQHGHYEKFSKICPNVLP